MILMRKMKNIKTGKIINVVELIMLKYNCWEYYVTDKKYNDGTAKILVCGYDNDVNFEIISLLEIKKEQVVFRNKNLKHLMPAPGWRWVNKKNQIYFLQDNTCFE